MKISHRLLTLFVWVIFLVTRLLIWTNPPQEFSQIIYVYMPYAHLWASGELPYLNQWYEYPPLTIPFFYLPHLIDMSTINHWYHLNYSDAYKVVLTLTDSAIFVMIWTALKKFKASHAGIVVSLIYYSLTTLKAHSFIYDSFDLLFAAAMIVAFVGPILWKRRGTFIGWIGYMAGIAIKYVNGPLGLVQAFVQRDNIKKLVIEVVFAGILIWILPLMYFRSSMLVTFEYHKIRGLQIESFPATLTRTINQWTRSEDVVEIAKAYDIAGPVSKQVGKIFKVIFPISLIIYMIFSIYLLQKSNRSLASKMSIWIALGYICVFMITSPVLSTPYLLWHIPFVALLPTENIRRKKWIMTVSFLIIFAGMTYFPNISLGFLTSHIWIGWFKTFGFGLILLWTIREMLSYGHRSLAK